jgi:hypothetical protein
MQTNESSRNRIWRISLTSEVEIELTQVLQLAGIAYRPGPIVDLTPVEAKGEERHP